MLKNRGYFRQIDVVDNVARAIATSQGLHIPAHINVIESCDPTIMGAVKAARSAISVMKAMSIIEE